MKLQVITIDAQSFKGANDRMLSMSGKASQTVLYIQPQTY